MNSSQDNLVISIASDEQAAREQADRDGVTHLSTGVAIISNGRVLVVRRAFDDYRGGQYE